MQQRTKELERQMADLKRSHQLELETLERDQRALVAKLARGSDQDTQELERVKKELQEVRRIVCCEQGGICITTSRICYCSHAPVLFSVGVSPSWDAPGAQAPV